jgi:hypothetical protein
MRNRPGSDFGIDLAAFKRADRRFVLPYALSVQVKAVEEAQEIDAGGVSVRIRSSTLASWLWSNTPTVCIVYEVLTGRMWWSVPVASSAARLDRSTASRTLRVEAGLDSEMDWLRFDAAVAELWSHHEGAGALMDVPLVLQLLTDMALYTDLWTRAGGTADAVHHAAAVHTYRTVASLNALAGRTGSEDFVGLAETAASEIGLSRGHGLVTRGDETLGVVSSIELRPWSTYLLEVFARSGRELAAAIPRLQQLARLPELGILADVASMLSRITDPQLSMINPDMAEKLTPADFAQVDDRVSLEVFPLSPEIDNQIPRPLARATRVLRPR